LNPNWIEPAFGNVEYALRWMGRWEEPAKVSEIATEIYEYGRWSDAELGEVRFVCFGETVNDDLRAKYPSVVQIPLDDVLEDSCANE
jgi:hypothetical protein